ncbi:MAG: hypothetical protein ACREKS_01325 [Candidatus Rokuibacteriota bacterium]
MTTRQRPGIWRRIEVHLAALAHRLDTLDDRVNGAAPVSRDIRRERAALRWAMAIVRMRAPEDTAMETPERGRVRFEKVFGPPIARRAEDRPPRWRNRADA